MPDTTLVYYQRVNADKNIVLLFMQTGNNKNKEKTFSAPERHEMKYKLKEHDSQHKKPGNFIEVFMIAILKIC
jgi:hypothetical protein